MGGERTSDMGQCSGKSAEDCGTPHARSTPSHQLQCAEEASNEDMQLIRQLDQMHAQTRAQEQAELDAVLAMSRKTADSKASALPDSKPPPYHQSSNVTAAPAASLDPPTGNAGPSQSTEQPAQVEQECAICCASLPVGQFKGQLTEGCTHARQMCNTCAKRFVSEELNGKGNSTRITCPEAGCSMVLQYHDVRKVTSNIDFDLYDSLCIKQAVQEMLEFRWCSRPGCGNGQIVAGGDDNPIMTCHGCQHRTCFNHRLEWHSGKSCEMYDADVGQSEEAQLVDWMQRHAKRCPKCSNGIEKNDGCDHMTCSQQAGGCGAEFCWRCSADYNGPAGIRAIGNTAHAPDCMWHA